MQSDGRSLIKIMSVPDHAGVAGTVIGSIGEMGINIELLVQSYDVDDCGNFSLVIDQKDLGRTLELLDRIKSTIDAKVITYTPDVAVITLFGHHLREKPQIHGTMFTAIAATGISVLAISTSLSSVSCVVEGQYVANVSQTLRDAFESPAEIKERPKDY
jgi:aspartate kinase